MTDSGMLRSIEFSWIWYIQNRILKSIMCKSVKTSQNERIICGDMYNGAKITI